MMILISYDGSTDAQAAIDHAAGLMPGAEVIVLTVWEPFLDAMERNGAMGGGLGFASGYVDDNGKIDAANEQTALGRATEGSERAAVAGLLATPRVARRHGSIARAILAVAEEVDADVVVLGTRGLSGVKSLMLGSVSHAVLHHADRSVLVVPSASVAEQRRSWSDTAHDAVGVE